MSSTTPISLQAVEHNARLREIEERLDRGSERMDLMQTELAANTAVTTEVRDILDTAAAGFRVLGTLGKGGLWVGKLAAAGTAIWGAWYALTHGGTPPGK